MFFKRKNKAPISENRNFQIAMFFTIYILAVAASAFAGYYYYADYTLQKVQKHTRESGHFQTELSYVDLPRISVTLSTDNGQSGIVRMDITLEVENKYVSEVEGFKPRITDRLIHYTQSLSYDDLSRPHSTVWLKPDMLQEVRQASEPAIVKDLIFREFLVL